MTHVVVPVVCIGCGLPAVDMLLDFGDQPPSNRFFRSDEREWECHSLRLGCCRRCGLVQLAQPMPPEMVRSRHPWLRYNEPEGHLDAMTDDLIDLCGVRSDFRVVGLSYKDDSTLARFKQRGFDDIHRLDPAADFGIDNPLAGLETLQESVTPDWAGRWVDRHGQADLLIVRHVLEHSHAPPSFLDALAQLVKPSGFLVFEVPESSKFLTACDYSFIWEEHIAYFTPETLRQLLPRARLRSRAIRSYEYPLEDSLMVVAGHADRGIPLRPLPLSYDAVASECARAAQYGCQFIETRARIREHLRNLKQEGARVALFGAGHLAVKFLNLLGLGDLVHCVVDDDPNKLGLRLPGSGLPIRPSSALLDENIDTCLLCLSPESERKVIAGQHRFLNNGGRFRSIFALSPIALVGALP